MEFDDDFIKERDNYELQRKEQLTAALTLAVGVLGGLGSLLALMARTYSFQNVALTTSFAPMFAMAVIALFVCLAFLLRPVNGDPAPQDRVRELILTAYAEFEQQSGK